MIRLKAMEMRKTRKNLLKEFLIKLEQYKQEEDQVKPLDKNINMLLWIETIP